MRNIQCPLCSPHVLHVAALKQGPFESRGGARRHDKFYGSDRLDEQAIVAPPGAGALALGHARAVALGWHRASIELLGMEAAPLMPEPENGRQRRFNDPDGEERPTVERPCLRCRRTIASFGPGNRLRDPCQSRASPLAL